jgi:hypothetical protein
VSLIDLTLVSGKSYGCVTVGTHARLTGRWPRTYTAMDSAPTAARTIV